MSQTIVSRVRYRSEINDRFSNEAERRALPQQQVGFSFPVITPSCSLIWLSSCAPWYVMHFRVVSFHCSAAFPVVEGRRQLAESRRDGNGLPFTSYLLPQCSLDVTAGRRFDGCRARRYFNRSPSLQVPAYRDGGQVSRGVILVR